MLHKELEKTQRRGIVCLWECLNWSHISPSLEITLCQSNKRMDYRQWKYFIRSRRRLNEGEQSFWGPNMGVCSQRRYWTWVQWAGTGQVTGGLEVGFYVLLQQLHIFGWDRYLRILLSILHEKEIIIKTVNKGAKWPRIGWFALVYYEMGFYSRNIHK